MNRFRNQVLICTLLGAVFCFTGLARQTTAQIDGRPDLQTWVRHDKLPVTDQEPTIEFDTGFDRLKHGWAMRNAAAPAWPIPVGELAGLCYGMARHAQVAFDIADPKPPGLYAETQALSEEKRTEYARRVMTVSAWKAKGDLDKRLPIAEASQPTEVARTLRNAAIEMLATGKPQVLFLEGTKPDADGKRPAAHAILLTEFRDFPDRIEFRIYDPNAPVPVAASTEQEEFYRTLVYDKRKFKMRFYAWSKDRPPQALDEFFDRYNAPRHDEDRFRKEVADELAAIRQEMRVQALRELTYDIEFDYRQAPNPAESGSRFEMTYTFRRKHAGPFPLRVRVTIKPNWVVEHGIGSAHLPNPAADTLISTDTDRLLILGRQPESTSWLFKAGDREEGLNIHWIFREVIGFAETTAAGDIAVPVESSKSGSAVEPSQILLGGWAALVRPTIETLSQTDLDSIVAYEKGCDAWVDRQVQQYRDLAEGFRTLHRDAEAISEAATALKFRYGFDQKLTPSQLASLQRDIAEHNGRVRQVLARRDELASRAGALSWTVAPPDVQDAFTAVVTKAEWPDRFKAILANLKATGQLTWRPEQSGSPLPYAQGKVPDDLRIARRPASYDPAINALTIKPEFPKYNLEARRDILAFELGKMIYSRESQEFREQFKPFAGQVRRELPGAPMVGEGDDIAGFAYAYRDFLFEPDKLPSPLRKMWDESQQGTRPDVVLSP